MAERHPVMGQDRQLSDEPALCSLCDAEIPEEHIPLVMYGPDLGDDCLAWQFCERCEGGVLYALLGDKFPKPAPPASVH